MPSTDSPSNALPTGEAPAKGEKGIFFSVKKSIFFARKKRIIEQSVLVQFVDEMGMGEL